MTQNFCYWEHNLDASYEIYEDDNFDSTIELIKTSCQSKQTWFPTVDSKNVPNIINPSFDYKYCPFCGNKIKSSIVIDM